MGQGFKNSSVPHPCPNRLQNPSLKFMAQHPKLMLDLYPRGTQEPVPQTVPGLGMALPPPEPFTLQSWGTSAFPPGGSKPHFSLPWVLSPPKGQGTPCVSLGRLRGCPAEHGAAFPAVDFISLLHVLWQFEAQHHLIPLLIFANSKESSSPAWKAGLRQTPVHLAP